MKKLSVAILYLLFMAYATQLFATEQVYDFDILNRYLESELDKANIPGTAIAIVDGDNILFEESYGNCTGTDESFIIGSLSKSFTAMAIMQLVDDRKMDLDDTIDTYLPHAKDGDIITVRQLLH